MRLPWHDSNLGLKDDEHEGVLVARVDTKPQAIYRVPQSTLHAVQPTKLAEYLQDKFKYKVLSQKTHADKLATSGDFTPRMVKSYDRKLQDFVSLMHLLN